MDSVVRWLATVLCCWGALGAYAGEAKGPSKLELSGAEHRMKAFEFRVQRMHGQPFKLGHNENDVLKRIKALTQKYPDDARVKALFARARTAIIASKGETVEVKPQAVVFRENAKKLRLLFAEESEKAYKAYLGKVSGEKGVITKPFPSPDPMKVDVDEYEGRTVVLEGFQYPDNEFTFMASQYCYAGSGTRGYYFVQLNNRAWVSVREAVRRYTRALGVEIPQQVGWTLVGKITGVHMLAPEAGKARKVMTAHLGWLVEPRGLYVPGYTFTEFQPQLELGATWAGEERAEEIKSSMYTVRDVPPDVKPKRLVEIFATAIMERNHKLYLDCIDPERRKTPKGLSRINYHWDLHLHRFATFYVRVDVGEPKVRVLRGFDPGSEFDSIFLTPEERKKVAATSEPLLEEAFVTSKAYDERGRQYGSPKPHFLWRKAKKRWYIINYPQPF
ncbi:hypothetical protein HQ560_17085 [bacterium]|nr:hypothetical protein [bacterium]